jgi:hypothetical protein
MKQLLQICQKLEIVSSTFVKFSSFVGGQNKEGVFVGPDIRKKYSIKTASLR